MERLFKKGDRVRIIRTPMLSESTQRETIGRTGTITDVSVPVGTAACLKVVWDEPFIDRFGYRHEYGYYYECVKALKLLEKEG